MDGRKVQSRGSARFHLPHSTTESSDGHLVSASSSSSSVGDKSSRFSEAATDSREREETRLAESSPIRRDGPIGSRSRPPKPPSSSNTTHVDAAVDVASRIRARPSSNPSIDRPRSKSPAIEPTTRATQQDEDRKRERPAEFAQAPKRPTSPRRAPSPSAPAVSENGEKKSDFEVSATTRSPDRVSRSRTGRKIYANRGENEARGQVTPSGRPPVEKNVERGVVAGSSLPPGTRESMKEGAGSRSGRSSSGAVVTENASASASSRMDLGDANNPDDGRDVALGSESVRVDVPLAIARHEGNVVPGPTTTALSDAVSSSVSPRQVARVARERTASNEIARSSAKKSGGGRRSSSDHRGPKSSRVGRTNHDPNVEAVAASSRRRASSGKSSSGSGGGVVAANGGRAPNGGRGRSRAAHKSSRNNATTEGRDRNADVAGAVRTETRRGTANKNERRASEAKRGRSPTGDGRKSKAAETKRAQQEEQDARAQSRSRSRAASNSSSGKLDPVLLNDILLYLP